MPELDLALQESLSEYLILGRAYQFLDRLHYLSYATVNQRIMHNPHIHTSVYNEYVHLIADHSDAIVSLDSAVSI